MGCDSSSSSRGKLVEVWKEAIELLRKFYINGGIKTGKTGHTQGGQRGWFLQGDLIGLVKDNSLWIYSTNATIHPEEPLSKTARHDSTLSTFKPIGSNRVVTLGDDRLIKISDVKSGALLSTQEADSDGFFSCNFNSDRTRLVTGSSGGSVKLWDTTVTPFRELLRLPAGPGLVHGVSFALNDQLIVINNFDASDFYFDSRAKPSEQELAIHK